jgi:D-glycero-D-manno-heptose 1,7-bisphosphate phosphatase
MTHKYKVANAAALPGMQCVIGIDRDGVINQDLGTYCTRPEDFKPIPGSLEAIAELRRRGHSIVIITNQGGIAKGLMTANDVDRIHMHMLDLLGAAGCPSIDAIYYSESSDKKDYYAKPNVGMFKRCQDEFKHIKFNQGFYVGDKMSDLKAAVKIGARPVLVRTGYGAETENQLNKFTYKDIKNKTYVFDSLADFVNQL